MPGHHPSCHAQTVPDHLAMVIADTGETLTYRELDDDSNRIAHLLRSQGLRPGDRIGMMLRNCVEFPKVYWGATRCGCMVTLLSTHLKPEEAAYILNDSKSKVLFVSGSVGETARTLSARRHELIPGIEAIYCTDDEPVEGADLLGKALSQFPSEPVADEIAGYHLPYSSGTTGRPKGIVIDFTPGPIDEFHPLEGFNDRYAAYDPLIYLNAGPLYHSAPLSCMITTHRLGGTLVTQRKFDTEGVLQAIDRWKVNCAQFVPTMFVRMLALPDEARARYDVSSLGFVVHAAAPCPVEVKRRMIEWWGPVIEEYYASTEGIGATWITADEWLKKPGSVGTTIMGPVHICDEEGKELPPGQSGVIYFETVGGRSIEYLNDAKKTKGTRHPRHQDWLTVGDIGRLDDDAYLFLTDRKDFMIISGGVNIYPQAIEDCLIVHPKVLDAAVIGVANPEYGEEVKAVVQPRNWADAGPGLEAELRDWCGERISKVTCPKSYEFVQELPRLPSGKLAKHELRKLYGNPVATVPGQLT